MMFSDEAQKYLLTAQPTLGNAIGALRNDLLSFCYGCGHAVPTDEIPREPIVDDYHRGEFYKKPLWANAKINTETTVGVFLKDNRIVFEERLATIKGNNRVYHLPSVMGLTPEEARQVTNIRLLKTDELSWTTWRHRCKNCGDDMIPYHVPPERLEHYRKRFSK